jgi:hypothetical protein
MEEADRAFELNRHSSGFRREDIGCASKQWLELLHPAAVPETIVGIVIATADEFRGLMRTLEPLSMEPTEQVLEFVSPLPEPGALLSLTTGGFVAQAGKSVNESWLSIGY